MVGGEHQGCRIKRPSGQGGRSGPSGPSGCDSMLVIKPANVRYLTGFSGSSGCALVTRRRKIFFTDPRYDLQARREVKSFGIVVSHEPALASVCRYMKSSRIKLTVLGYEGENLTCRQLSYLRRQLKGIRLQDRSGCIEDQRLVKTSAEMARMRRAARMADLALEGLVRSRVVGKTERQVALELEMAMREAGSEKLPFEIIVASGFRSAMPHGVASDRLIRQNELIVVDLGASSGGYCSDMTRTFSTGSLSAKQREIYGTVQEAQALAVQAVKPGADCASVDRMARDHISAAGYGEAFGHSLGHGVGLEAHEEPVLSSRSKQILKEGMVVTVEPGIYLPRIGGVRIEDTVLVGKKGPISLTRFPRDLIKLR